jgi:hypothetical protein
MGLLARIATMRPVLPVKGSTAEYLSLLVLARTVTHVGHIFYGCRGLTLLLLGSMNAALYMRARSMHHVEADG